MKKLTNVLALEMVLGMKEVQSNEALVEKLTAMKAQFEKKNNRTTNGEKKPSKAKLENMELAEELKELLTEEFKTQKDLQAELGVETSQKMTSVVKILLNDDIAVKEVIKGKTCIKLKGE